MQKRILLVATYEKKSRSFLKPQGGQISIRKYLERKMKEQVFIEITDPQIDGVNNTREVIKEQWDFIGFYTTYPTLLNSIELMECARMYNDESIIIVGGPGAYYKRIFDISPADIIIEGEGEKAMEYIIQSCSENKLDKKTAESICKQISGISIRIIEPQVHIIKSYHICRECNLICGNTELNNLMLMTEWERELHKKYIKWTKENLNHIYGFPVFFVRGCASIGCKFCSSYNAFSSKKGIRVCDAKVAFELIKQISRIFPECTDILVEDDNFLSNIYWVKEFCRYVIDAKANGDISSKIEFIVKTRVDQINEENLTLLKKIGVKQLNVGIESVSESVLLELNKTNNVEQYLLCTRTLINKIKSYDIKIHCYLIFFTPNSTLNDFIDNIEFTCLLLYNKMEVSCYSTLLAFPGSNYEKDWEEKPEIVHWKTVRNPLYNSSRHEIIENKFKHETYSFLPYEIDMPEYMEINDKCLRKIYEKVEKDFDKLWDIYAVKKDWKVRTSYRSTYLRVLLYIRELKKICKEEKVESYNFQLAKCELLLDKMDNDLFEVIEENMACE